MIETNHMKFQIFIISFLLSLDLLAQKTGPDIKSVFQEFRKAPLITLKVDKKTKSELMGTETNAPGTIYISQEKFRWDTDGKEKSRIIFDGEVVWTIQDPPEGFKIPPQVTKMKFNKKSEGQLLLKSLFTDKFDSHFKVKKKSKSKSDWVYTLAPVKNNSMFSELEVRIGANNKIREISYVDEIQNRIEVVVNKIERSKAKNDKLFQYSPPSDAQVTEI